MESASYPHSEVANLEQLADPRYLAAMAEAVTQEQSDYAAPSSTSPSRRKRSAPDSSPAESRRAKRGAASATMSNHADVEAAASYVESAVEAAQAAAAASVNAADFTALQQATQADHHESADPANASSTAAAALGSMYPTIHVPPTTEETFAAQAANENEHNSYGSNDMVPTDSMPDPSNQGPPQGPPQPGQNGLRSGAPVFQSPVQQPAGHRPAVGSEEWHKQRKDNHKEGESNDKVMEYAADQVKLNADEGKLSMKVLMSWQRLSLDVKRTRAPSSSVPSPSSHNSRRTRRKTLKSGRWRSCSRNRPFKS